MLMKKMLAIILVSLVLSGCEKNGSQNDLIINNTEEENVVMDENDDYELKNIEMGRKEEKDISDRLRKMVGKCKRIYSQADKGNASNIVLEEETVHTMIESIAEENVAITCGSHDYNMLNYKQVDDALSLAKTGENTETEFFVINTSGVWIYNRNLLGGLYRENPVKSRNYEAVKSSKKWENVGNSYIIPALLLYRYSYI